MPKELVGFRRGTPYGTKREPPRLLNRIHRLLYEFAELGLFEQAKEPILELMQLAKEAEERK